MNPVLASLAYGLVKGVMQRRADPRPFSLGAVILGPLREEAMYRAGSHYAGLPGGFSAFAFAADHVFSDASHDGLQTKHVVPRFADVFMGGLLYEQAYRRWGFFGAFAAHALHNLGVHFGSQAGRKP
jgi:membrane protease YdiL (CAAX protease family)